MKLLIVEPIASGHHMALYVRLVVREAYKREWKVGLLTSKGALKDPSFKLVQSERYNDMDIFVIDDVKPSSKKNMLSLFIDQYNYYRAIKNGFKKIPLYKIPDRVYVSNLDHFDKVLPFLPSPFGNVKFSGMMMNLKFHRKKMGFGKPSRNDLLFEQLFLRVLRKANLHSVMVIDEPFLEYGKHSRHQEYSKLCFVPDVGDLRGKSSRVEAKKYFGIPIGNFVILVYGFLSKKKGIENLLRAVNNTALKKISVLLSGIQDEYTRELLSGSLAKTLINSGQLIISNGFHDDEKEYKAFKSANCVWVGYVGSQFGSSGVLYQSASMGLPLLGTADGLVGWIINKHCIGLVFDPVNIFECTNAIKEIYCNEELLMRLGQNAKKLSLNHTSEKFGEAICDQLEIQVMD
jgi:glycosyltransferase involved in cell wall biosynthesis